MVSRCVLLIMLLRAKGCLWFCENPRSSLLESHPRMQWLIRKRCVFKASFRMGDFGAGCEKHTWIYSSHSCILDLPGYRTRTFDPKADKEIETRVIGVLSDGSTGVWGSKDLKNTQEYPLDFGRAVQRLYRDNRRQIERDMQKMRAAVRKANVSLDVLYDKAVNGGTEDHIWADARLSQAFGALF
jgi:hypothetical protein